MNKQELIEKINGLDELALNQHYLTWLVEQLDEPQPPRLKDIIARMEGLSSHVRSEWLDDILYKFGHDYGTLKYKAGYEQGKVEGLIEREKVTIPKFVADWIEKCKENNIISLSGAFEYAKEEVDIWLSDWTNQETFARAWLDGYEVEKEKRYYVRFKWIEESYSYLTLIKHLNAWTLYSITLDKKFRTEHTKKQLEEAGFGWVFDCPGVEIEEVEE